MMLGLFTSLSFRLYQIVIFSYVLAPSFSFSVVLMFQNVPLTLVPNRVYTSRPKSSQIVAIRKPAKHLSHLHHTKILAPSLFLIRQERPLSFS